MNFVSAQHSDAHRPAGRKTPDDERRYSTTFAMTSSFWEWALAMNSILLVGVKFLHTPRTYKLLKSLLWELQSGHIPEMERKKERSTRRRKR